jgi:hypothetical protein
MRRAKNGLGGVLQGPYSVLLGQRSCIVFFAVVALGQWREVKAFLRPSECQEKQAGRAARNRFSAKRLLNLHKVCNFVPQFKIFKRRNK